LSKEVTNRAVSVAGRRLNAKPVVKGCRIGLGVGMPTVRMIVVVAARFPRGAMLIRNAGTVGMAAARGVKAKDGVIMNSARNEGTNRENRDQQPRLRLAGNPTHKGRQPKRLAAQI
jgi:hypothetical protein